MEAKRFGRILLLVDSSGESRRAAAAAIELAVLRGQARLFALNVIDKALVNRMKPFADKKVAELEIELEENGWKYLYHVEELAKDRGVPTMILQTCGVLDHEVLKEAKRLHIDLIVMAYPAHTLGQMRRLVVGHIDKTIENAECDVLVVR